MTLSRLRFAVLSFLLTLLGLGAGVMMVYISLDTFASGGYSYRGRFFTADRHPLSFWAHVAIAWVSGVMAIAATPLAAWGAWKSTAQEQREIERMLPKIYGPTRRWLIVTLVILLIPVLLFAFSAKAATLARAEAGLSSSVSRT